jgi:hypothetical protein
VRGGEREDLFVFHDRDERTQGSRADRNKQIGHSASHYSTTCRLSRNLLSMHVLDVGDLQDHLVFEQRRTHSACTIPHGSTGVDVLDSRGLRKRKLSVLNRSEYALRAKSGPEQGCFRPRFYLMVHSSHYVTKLLAQVRVDANVLKVYVQQVSRCRSLSSFVLTLNHSCFVYPTRNTHGDVSYETTLASSIPPDIHK